MSNVSYATFFVTITLTGHKCLIGLKFGGKNVGGTHINGTN
jgi:hypothetical protein